MLLQTSKPSRELIIASAVDQIRNRSISTAQALKRCLQDSAKIVWQNADGLTPEEVLTGFGPDAGDLFAKSALAVEFLVKAGVMTEAEAGALRPAGYTFAINQDGTVTLTKA